MRQESQLGRSSTESRIRQQALPHIDEVARILKTVSSVALPVVIGVLGALAATGNLFGVSPVLVAIQLSSIVLAAWARRSFVRGSFRVVATPGAETLLRTGPYRFIRHPMYTAALLLVWSGVVAHATSWTVALGALATCVVVGRIVYEERLLREHFGDYVQYARTTKALIPFIV